MLLRRLLPSLMSATTLLLVALFPLCDSQPRMFQHAMLRSNDNTQPNIALTDKSNLGDDSPTSPKVHLEMLYRAYCGACKEFFKRGILNDLVSHPELGPLVELQLWPVAQMSNSEDDDSKVLTCEAGPEECNAHRYLGCAMNKLVDPVRYLPLLVCLESDLENDSSDEAEKTPIDWKHKLETCAAALVTPESDADVAAIHDCAVDYETSTALLLPGLQRETDLEPPVSPYLYANNVSVVGNSRSVPTAQELNTAICMALPLALRTTLTVCDWERVHVMIFWRAFCPACKWYISDPILNLVTDPAFAPIIEMQFLPVAGMVDDPSLSDTDLAYRCSGGEDECLGHRYFVCVLELHEIALAVEILGCLEQNVGDDSDYKGTTNSCVDSPADAAPIHECVINNSGMLLTNMLTAMSPNLEITWMPYTVLDHHIVCGASGGAALDEVEIKDYICKQFNGPSERVPDECADLLADSALQTQNRPLMNRIKPCPQKKRDKRVHAQSLSDSTASEPQPFSTVAKLGCIVFVLGMVRYCDLLLQKSGNSQKSR